MCSVCCIANRVVSGVRSVPVASYIGQTGCFLKKKERVQSGLQTQQHHITLMTIQHTQHMNTSYPSKFNTYNISVFYILTYIANYMFKTLCFISVHWFGCLCNISFEINNPENDHKRRPKHAGG